uniref:RNase H type-1 domain-containing protein n=1 Tax=Pelusios castaneus TaxID=367368 RepID=A0A8C8VJV4_9SAUR
MAVLLAVQESKVDPTYIYTDNWVTYVCLTSWMAVWCHQDWAIHGRSIWGGPNIWEQLWTFAKTKTLAVGHVDAHTKRQDKATLHNAVADAACRETHCGPVLAQWAHDRSGHGGTQATQEWARTRGIPLTRDEARTAVDHCPRCAELKGQLLQRVIWQCDYIGPFPTEKQQKYFTLGLEGPASSHTAYSGDTC